MGVSSEDGLFVVASMCLRVGLSSVPLFVRGGAMLVVNGVVDLFCGWLLWASVGVVVGLWVFGFGLALLLNSSVIALRARARASGWLLCGQSDHRCAQEPHPQQASGF